MRSLEVLEFGFQNGVGNMLELNVLLSSWSFATNINDHTTTPFWVITQPSHPFMGRCNEYQPEGGDTLRLGSKGRYGLCAGGR